MTFEFDRGIAVTAAADGHYAADLSFATAGSQVRFRCELTQA